jgi:hypothetical protein
MLAAANRLPDVKRLVEKISGQSRIGLRDAMRLRDLGLPPFRGATVFVLDENDAVESVGCTTVTETVSIATILAALRRLAA